MVIVIFMYSNGKKVRTRGKEKYILIRTTLHHLYSREIEKNRNDKQMTIHNERCIYDSIKKAIHIVKSLFIKKFHSVGC